MSQRDKFRKKLLDPKNRRNINLDRLIHYLVYIGFDDDRKLGGSHHVLTRAGIEEIINLQPGEGGLAKPYQVAQVRELIEKYKL